MLKPRIAPRPTCAMGALALASASLAQGVGPTPYLCSSDSPLASVGPWTYFHLETFEDGALNTPGVTASTGNVLGTSVNTDSVDCDDGLIDGSGVGGHSWFSGSGSAGVTFTFSAATLGALPTAVGIVWTDGAANITFQAFNASDVLLGTVTGNHADGVSNGTTVDDRFYGWVDPAGIAKIKITNSSGGIEIDHLQYGRSLCPVAITQPGAKTTPGPVQVAGSFLGLSVSVVGQSASNFQWRKTGAPIANGPTPSGSIVSGATTAQLSIASAGAADLGTYDCVVSTGCGTFTTSPAVVGFVCYANCDASTGAPALSAGDFVCFLTAFRGSSPYANCDGSTGSPLLSAADFVCFLNAFRAGCP